MANTHNRLMQFFWRFIWLSVLVGIAVLSGRSGSAQSSSLPVVPGAFGFGMNTRAAYGCGSNPTVYRVTTLNDSGTGSLRAALNAAGPRVVVFEISGYIDISSDIAVTNPCVTVAGQTAPSPGITVRMVPGASEAMFLINAHDVLFQHFRIRPGSTTCNSGIQVYGGNQYNIVLDHMSLSWAQDENLMIAWTTANGGNVNATVWRSIASEGLFQAPGSGSCTGGGASNGHGIGIDRANQVAVLQNVFAHNLERNPYPGGASSSYVANNVIYDAHEGPLYADVVGYGPLLATLVGNYIKRGPTSSADFAVATRYLKAGSQLYMNDNTIDNGGLTPPLTPFLVINGDGIDPRVGSAPVTPSGYSPMAATSAYGSVIANAGARPWDRDAVDTRILAEVQTRTGHVISTPADVGGYPTLAVNRRALTLPANPDTATSSGYTNLELWLQSFAAGSQPAALTAPTGLRIISN